MGRLFPSGLDLDRVKLGARFINVLYLYLVNAPLKRLSGQAKQIHSLNALGSIIVKTPNVVLN